jgi:hypothetical protein
MHRLAHRRTSQLIRDLLIRDWDPIGVQDFPAAHGEYDGYVAAVVALVEKGSSAMDIFRFLWDVETRRMGLRGDPEATQRVAATLAALRAEPSR